MGTEEVRTAVLQEATAQADALVEAALSRASRILENEKQALQANADTQLMEYRSKRQRETVTKSAALRIELRNAVLQRKQELLEELYRSVERTIGETDTLYRQYLARAVSAIGDDTLSLIECREDDTAVLRELVSRRPDAGTIIIESTLSPSERGFRAHVARATIDLTLSAAVAALKEETTIEVAQTLFAQGI